MKHEKEIKERLISNAIHLIAEGGFEKATTKELSYYGGDLPDIKMNEVYIYRIFGSKEKLFEATFSFLDNELFYAFKHGEDSINDLKNNLKSGLYSYFLNAWRFILGNEDRCRCYVRYYYSIYFNGHSLETHQALFKDVIAKLVPFFKDDADVINILHSVFTSLLNFGIRVYNGELEDTEVNRAHVFNVLYCMMVTYLKNQHLRTEDRNVS